jgi:polysaccharide export outer membrane protein
MSIAVKIHASAYPGRKPDMLSWTGLPNAARLILTLMAIALSGCSTLPSSGPTASQIVSRATDGNKEFRFNIVPLDSQAVATLNQAQSARIAAVTTLGLMQAPLRQGSLGPGDVLQVSVYEVGVSLFSRANPATTGVFDTSAHSERFPEVTVDEMGNIALPFIGTLAVAGYTPAQVETLINQQLAGQSQHPQAMVTLIKNVSSTVIVAGNVNRPGRYDLTFNHERLLDAVALAGGASASSEDTLVRFERDGRTIEQRLDMIRASSTDDLVLKPGDHIELVKRPRSFTVFGAAGRVSQISFDTGGVSLAEALARVQGPMDATADPTAIFVFRYDDTIDPASGAKPVIYRLNLIDPASYFLAQQVAMQDKDVIYIANSASNQPSKLIGIINQLFSPIITARALTRN